MKLMTACFVLMLTLLGPGPALCAPGPVPVPRAGGRLPGAAAGVAPALPGQVQRHCLAPAPGVSALGEVNRPPTAPRPAAGPAPAARRMPRPVRLGLVLRMIRRAVAPPGDGVAGRSGSNIKPIGWVALGFGIACILAFLTFLFLSSQFFFIALNFFAAWGLLAIVAIVLGIIGIVCCDGPTQTLSIVALVLGTVGPLIILMLVMLIFVLLSI